MEKHATEQVPRSGWRPGFYMKSKHIGLVLCVSLVGCMVAFGAGFIVGMGYKASEQVSPYAVKKPPAVQSADQQNVSNAAWKEDSLTFYDSLIRPVETIQAPESVPMTAAPAAPPTPTPAPPVQPVVAEDTGLDPQATDQGMTATETAPAPSASPAAPATPSVPVAVPPIQPAMAEGTDLDSLAASLAEDSPLDADQSVVTTYSVQVASFLTPERAQRLIEELTKKGYRAYVHPFEVPGQQSWYRVKVGKFADRATANLALQQLGTPDAMITRD